MRQIVYDALVEPIGPNPQPATLNNDSPLPPTRRVAAAFAAAAITFGGHALAPIPVKAVGQPGQFSNVLIRPALIYQAGVTPVQPVPVNATPGWEGIRLDYGFAKPVPAAAQQFASFLLGPPAAPQGYAGYQLNVAFAKPFSASQQQFQSFTRGSVPIAATPGWEGVRLDYAFTKPLQPAQQQFQTFTRGSVPVNATPGWDARLDTAFTKPFSASTQQFTGFIAAPAVGATGVGQPGVFGNVLIRPAVIYQAGVTPVQPIVSVVTSGFYPGTPAERFANPLSASQQQFQSFTRGSVPVAATPGWEGIRLDYRFAKPVNAATQQFAAAQSLATVTAATGVGQSGSFSSVLSRPNLIYQAGVTPLRPLAPVFTAIGWNASSPAVVAFPINLGDGGELAGFVDFQPQGWWPDYPVQFATPFKAALQSYSSATRGAIVSVTPQGFFGYQFDFAFTKRFPIGLQQFEALKSPLTTTPVRGWFPDYPVRFGTPFKASGQQFGSFQPLGTIASTDNNAVNWQTLSPERFVRAVLPQQWSSFQPQGQITSTFPDGFRGPQWDVRFANPLSASQQQFAGFLLASAPSPQGYAGYQLHTAFARPFNAAQQQYLAFGQPVAASPSNTQVHGWQNVSPELFAKGFPVTLQQYEARGHRRIPTVTPLPPDGSSGHRKPPKKSVQPIWDRQQQPAKATAPAIVAPKLAAPAEPAAAPPTKPLSSEAQSLLTRQILPSGPVIPPPAHATITLAEDNDTMTATAEWNDDEIALALLLGDDLEDE